MSAQTQTRISTGTHQLRIETPNYTDYRNGGYGDLVAQCFCGIHEYVATHQEGRYWHWLHRTNPGARGLALLGLLVIKPMPEGWEEPAAEPDRTSAAVATARRYTCPGCLGAGTVEAYGAHGHRFYQQGERRSCPDCAGSGTTDRWTWEGAKKIEAAA